MHLKFSHFGWLLASLVIALATAGIFAANVQFLPDGVPLARRAEYERVLASIKAKEEGRLELLSSESPRPIVVCDASEFRFGTVDPHQTVAHPFKIRNEGSADLLLRQGETSCKCTVGEISSSIVSPGQTAEVLVTWNTGYKADNYTQTAVILTNDPVTPEIELKVSGTVRADLVITHQALEFPAVSLAHQTKVSTYVYSQLWDDFTIEQIECDAPEFAWTAEPIDVNALPEGDLQARSAWKVTAFATPTVSGKFTATAKVSVASITGEKALREFTLVGTTLGSIEFKSPIIDVNNGLDLGLMVNDQQHEKSLIVKARTLGSRKLEVLDIKPDQLQAKLEPTKQEGSFRLTITVPKDAKPAIFNLRASQESSRGYVQVGDPADKSYSNWMPLTGVIIDAALHNAPNLKRAQE